MPKISLFGKEINVREYYCQFFENDAQKIDVPYINFYVRFKGCNATCKFCDSQNNANKFNEEKYFQILNEIKSNVYINKIAFTGGEPTLNFDFFENIVNKSHDIVKTYLSVNTNGINLNKIFESEIIDKLSCVSLSRHHYQDKKNNEILGFKSTSTKTLKSIKSKKIHITCNLIKDYIDSKKEILKFLEYVNSLGITSASFVSLMPLNDYCKDNFIDFETIDLDSKEFNLIKCWKYKDYCRCNNWIYMPKKNDNFIKVYYKNTYVPIVVGEDVRDLVFDGENLKSGFADEIIF